MIIKGFLQDELEYGQEFTVRRYTGHHVMPIPHIHAHYEIYFCPENVAQRSVINGVEYNYKYPCAIISKPYTIHSSSCMDESSGYRRYVISADENKIKAFDTPMLASVLTSEGMGIFFRLTEDEARYIEELFNAFFFHDKYKMESSEYDAAISFILTKIYNFAKASRIIEVGCAESYVHRALRYISENFDGNIDSADIALRFNVSRSKLDRDFKAATGTTAKTFLDTCIFNRAKHLLRTRPQMTVKDIAETLGFTNITYFFRFFAKYEGMSPNVYRKYHHHEEE